MTRTNSCDEAGDYVVPNVLSPRELDFRPDNMKLYYHHHPYEIDMHIFCIGSLMVMLNSVPWTVYLKSGSGVKSDSIQNEMTI